MVIIADDLTGAADCAASSAALGYKAVILMHPLDDQRCEEGCSDADILSIDANTRCLPVEQASEVTSQLVRRWDARFAGGPGYVLYKKIDSTLRGNVAAELTALLSARRSSNHGSSTISILMAPAAPALGRTMVYGRLLVRGVPLEETDIWQAEAGTPQSNISHLLAHAHLSSELIDIDTVRSSPTSLHEAIHRSAEKSDVVVCDAETDSDLCAIAEASLEVPAITALVGSAGLACQLPRAIGMTPKPGPCEWNFADGPTLFVVGTTSSISREQVRLLREDSEVATVCADPTSMQGFSSIRTEVMQKLESGRDVLLTLNGVDRIPSYKERFIQEALSQVASTCAQFLGGVVATGGATARAVLNEFGIDRLRLLGEVEPGLAFSVADRWLRPLPVITKAGAFGSPQTLVRSHEFLAKLKRVPPQTSEKSPLKLREI
ncbi:four-carbon acid sugar kinase family protein [Occallatibacter savannae]|uniref:four-carbon acid sugar kinase family protein n=1 Tax=Occallatibacter savannae TaxID=1002691 RepID=UPI000D692D9F|nr:four-carbon acid sugar kinase family protein [Occallatibacter savannae]